MSNVSSINDPSSERKRSFSFSDEGPILETLDYAIRISAVHRPFYILICISTLPTQTTQHTTFLLYIVYVVASI